MSPSSASKADKLGYTNVRVFAGGLPSWKQAKNPVYVTSTYIKASRAAQFPLILVDIRDKSTAAKGYIDGSVSYTPDQLKQARRNFPKVRNAPIIIISDDGAEAKEAFGTVRGWGYMNASILEGGVKGWTRAGNSLKQGQLGSKIAYVPKPVPGSIAVERFKTIAKSRPHDTVIIDVRDKSEAARGMLRTAINIPTQEIGSRLSEIPKDKKIVVYCQTGVRASMAYQTLKEAGYNVQFLNTQIQIKPDGRFRVKS